MTHSMISMFDYYPSPWSNNVWTPWIKHMIGQEDCGVLQAAMVKPKKRQVAACTREFVPSSKDIQLMTAAFEDKTVDRIEIKDQTFMLLPRSFTRDPSMLVGFNGSKYIIIGTSQTMYVIMLIKMGNPTGNTNGDRVRKTLELMKKITGKLTQNKY